ncbi:hypothetical protein U6G28_08755 [Actinomycetaceae bacterium MB13-C1-2]|nr:hypothetical protein U6G28_08755 [Actinomycetaceae bacterium MB13-C1-2]
MASGLYGPRSPSWLIELLDSEDQVLDVLDTVESHSIEIAATERLGGHAEMLINERGLDWMSHRVRFTYDPGVKGVEAWPYGVFLLSSPTESRKLGAPSYKVSCKTKLSVIDEAAYAQALSFPAGTDVVATVVDLIQSTGETAIAATNQGITLTSPMSFDAGESLLSVINEMLTSIGYWSLSVDTYGVFQIGPWTAPASRTPAWSFEAGELSLYRPGWTRTQDRSSVPNVVVASTSGSDEDPAIVGVARNDDPDSDYSTISRGREIAKRYDIDAESQASASSQAQQLLLGAMDPVLKVEVEHALVPLQANDAVLFWPQGDEAPRKHTVQRMSISSGFDAHCKATWRGVSGFELGQDQGSNL